MTGIFDKLNLKDQKETLVINAPAEFEPVLEEIRSIEIKRDVQSVNEITFSLAFVEKKVELDIISDAIVKITRADALLWPAYPKRTSKNYEYDFNRDTGWDVLEAAGFRGIRWWQSMRIGRHYASVDWNTLNLKSKHNNC